MFDLLQNPMNNFPLYIFSNHFFQIHHFLSSLLIFALSFLYSYSQNTAHMSSLLLYFQEYRSPNTNNYSSSLPKDSWAFLPPHLEIQIISHLNRVLSILFPQQIKLFLLYNPLWLFSQSSLDIMLHTQCPLQ